MTLEIKRLNGDRIELDLWDKVFPLNLVEDVMLVIQQKTGLPVEQQRLIYCGKQLENKKALSEYNIGKMSGPLHLVEKLVAGPAEKDPSSRVELWDLLVEMPSGSELEFTVKNSMTVGELKRRIKEVTSFPENAQVLMSGACDCSDPAGKRRRTIEDEMNVGGAASSSRAGGAAAPAPRRDGDPLPNGCELRGADLCSSCRRLVLKLVNPDSTATCVKKLIYVQSFRVGGQVNHWSPRPYKTIWVPVAASSAEMRDIFAKEAFDNSIGATSAILGMRCGGVSVKPNQQMEHTMFMNYYTHGPSRTVGVGAPTLFEVASGVRVAGPVEHGELWRVYEGKSFWVTCPCVLFCMFVRSNSMI